MIVNSGPSPFPKVEDVLNLARVRVNDIGNGIEGDLLNDDQPSTLVYLNAAWHWLQVKATNNGVSDYIREYTVTGFPATTDSTQQSWIGYGGSGAGGFQFNSPTLPSDLILPLNVWADNGNGLYEMSQADSGLPIWQQPGVYDWRTDGIYFYGELFPVNLRIRYAAMREDLGFGGLVPMMFSKDALSARVAFEFANARGATQAAAMATLSEAAFDEISQATGRKNQRRSLRRQSFSGRGSFSGNVWPIIR